MQLYKNYKDDRAHWRKIHQDKKEERFTGITPPFPLRKLHLLRNV